jgi:hypothetical protein
MTTLTSYEPVTVDRVGEYMTSHGISTEYRSALDEMNKYEAIFILDDSYSMKGPNWTLLQSLAKKIIDFSLLFDSKFDAYFLNRGTASDIESFAALSPHLTEPTPVGTPLFRTLDRVLAEKASILAERQIALYILTDGSPSDSVEGVTGYEGVAKWFETRIKTNDLFKERIAFTFQMCTEDKAVLAGYNSAVDSIDYARVDVMGTPRQEKAEVEANNKQKGFVYTDGLDTTRRVTAGTNKALDDIDQVQVRIAGGVVDTEGELPKGCCVVS